jgi:hypothetical protein
LKSQNDGDGIVPLACWEVVIPPGRNVTVPPGTHAVGKTLDVPSNAQLLLKPADTMEIEDQKAPELPPISRGLKLFDLV